MMLKETEEKTVEEHVQETETKPKMHKQTARRGVHLHPAKRNLDRQKNILGNEEGRKY